MLLLVFFTLPSSGRGPFTVCQDSGQTFADDPGMIGKATLICVICH